MAGRTASRTEVTGRKMTRKGRVVMVWRQGGWGCSYRRRKIMGITLPPPIVILLYYTIKGPSMPGHRGPTTGHTDWCVLVPDANCGPGFHAPKMAGSGAGKSHKLVFQSGVNHRSCESQRVFDHIVPTLYAWSEIKCMKLARRKMKQGQNTYGYLLVRSRNSPILTAFSLSVSLFKNSTLYFCGRLY